MNRRHTFTTSVFASLWEFREVFTWSDCLLDLATDFLVGDTVFVRDYVVSCSSTSFSWLVFYFAALLWGSTIHNHIGRQIWQVSTSVVGTERNACILYMGLIEWTVSCETFIHVQYNWKLESGGFEREGGLSQKRFIKRSIAHKQSDLIYRYFLGASNGAE